MENVNCILCIIYLLLGILNIVGMVNIEECAIFGLTIGALFLCIAPLFDKKIWRGLFYFLAAGFIVGFQLIDGANDIIKNIDNNTWLLLSLAVTFLANYLSTTKAIELKLKDRENGNKIRENDIQTLKEVQRLRNEITRLRVQLNDKDDE